MQEGQQEMLELVLLFFGERLMNPRTILNVVDCPFELFAIPIKLGLLRCLLRFDGLLRCLLRFDGLLQVLAVFAAPTSGE